MNRSTMRARLRRRLNDTASDFYDDSSLNDLLDDGLRFMQKEVEKVDPLAFINVDRINVLIADGGYIPKPQGFRREIELGYKDSSATGGYRALDIADYYVARDNTTGSSVVYSHLGRFFFLTPAPSADITNGLQLLWVPTLTMAVDTDVPDLDISLHHGVVVKAQLIAMGDTKDDTSVPHKELDEMVADIPTYYRKSANQSDRIELLGLGKNY